MSRKAFTLIELLVVIAIIAILAAILFPVFAQAKLAAKGAVTVSNLKQNALAEVMYQNDFDDNFVLATTWNTGSDPVCFGAGLCASPWIWIVQPYEKNAAINNDPMAPVVAVPSGWTQSAWISIFPSMGYNYGSLSPFVQNGSAAPVTQAISSSTLSGPSSMPMFGGKDAATEMTTGTVDLYGYQFNANTDNGPLLNGTIERPFCNEALYCLASWGFDTGSDLQGQVDTLLSDNQMAGARTGRVALRAGNQGVIAFADGHAKKMTPGALAVGTSFNITAPSANTTITDMNSYVWTDTPGSY